MNFPDLLLSWSNNVDTFLYPGGNDIPPVARFLFERPQSMKADSTPYGNPSQSLHIRDVQIVYTSQRLRYRAHLQYRCHCRESEENFLCVSRSLPGDSESNRLPVRTHP